MSLDKGLNAPGRSNVPSEVAERLIRASDRLVVSMEGENAESAVVCDRHGGSNRRSFRTAHALRPGDGDSLELAQELLSGPHCAEPTSTGRSRHRGDT